MLWYASMLNQDRKDTFDAKLNMTEYLASFINYEAVKQTRYGRENQTVISDADFEQQLRNQFGRDLSPEKLATATRAETIDETDLKPNKDAKKRGSISIEDIKKYTGLELDEVKFHPIKK